LNSAFGGKKRSSERNGWLATNDSEAVGMKEKLLFLPRDKDLRTRRFCLLNNYDLNIVLIYLDFLE
jgi:hypothetical protein